MLITYVTRLNRLCLILALSAAPASLRAQDFNLCSYVTPLIPAAQANFPADYTTLPLPPKASSCTMWKILSGANSYLCAWEFPYRKNQARAIFDAYNQSLIGCPAGLVEIELDQSVNHPDFYLRRQYTLGKVTIGMSLKDRAELKHSYVFLRITGAIPQ